MDAPRAFSPLEEHSPASSPYHSKLDRKVTLQVRVQRTRLVVGILAIVLVVVGIVVRFCYGVTLLKVDKKIKDTTTSDTDKLVDDYNSYSANVAVAATRPISVAVGLMAQVAILRYATVLFLGKSKRKWRLRISIIVVAAMLEYLVLNGFNALNVQLRPLSIRAVISMSDLSLSSAINSSIPNGNITNASATYSEKSPRNPAANTVLRSLLLPRVMRPEPSVRKCIDGSSSIERDDTVSYGFPAISWQGDMLKEALEPQILRIPINATSRFNPIPTARSPMRVARAANLFANALYVSRSMVTS